MRLYYYRDRHGNFGDDLNAWMWERLMPGCWDPTDGVAMSAIGTIIRHGMPRARKWIVFSSGTGYGALPRNFGGPGWHVAGVRGPLTAKVLGLPAEAAVTDGAILLNLLSEYQPLPESKRSGIVFMPHHKAAEVGEWTRACNLAGVPLSAPGGGLQEES